MYISIKLSSGKPVESSPPHETNDLVDGFTEVWTFQQWDDYLSSINQPLPDGKDLPLKIQSASGQKYVGTALSSTYHQGYGADFSFDGNSGTRHYSAKNQSLNHWCCIVMQQITMLTSIEYNGEHGSSEFRLEYSNNSTNGVDGTWITIGDIDCDNKTIDLSGYKIVGTAFKITWISPKNSEWASVRNIIMFGKQHA